MNLESVQARRAVIIYNPVARGLSRRLHLLQRSIALLARQGIEARLIATTAPGSASSQVSSEISAGCDLVIAAGGDGTINEVANGMFRSDVPLAILPGGTANVLAREMRIPIDVERAAAGISGLRPSRIATGGIRIQSSAQRCFLCMAGAGLDASIVSRINVNLKTRTGKFAYYIGGFSHIARRLEEFEVIIDGKQFEASFALISRVRNYGGDLEIARGASLLLDDFEIVLFRGEMSIGYLRYLLGAILRCAHRMKGVTVLRGTKVICQFPGSQDIFVQVDGELAGRLPITAEIIPRALTLLLPPHFLAREQSHAAVPVAPERSEWITSRTR